MDSGGCSRDTVQGAWYKHRLLPSLPFPTPGPTSAAATGKGHKQHHTPFSPLSCLVKTSQSADLHKYKQHPLLNSGNE